MLHHNRYLQKLSIFAPPPCNAYIFLYPKFWVGTVIKVDGDDLVLPRGGRAKMATSLSSCTAFRFFGNFHWPPLPGNALPDPGVDGVVEFHYVEDAGSRVAVVRWLPRVCLDGEISTKFALSKPQFDTLDRLQELDSAGLAAKFQHNDEIVQLRLDGQNPLAAAGERLLFRGAQVFDQFKLDTQSNYASNITSNFGVKDPKPDLRWILARHFDRAGKSYFAEVVLGKAGDTPASGSTIRFNLALPTVVPQSVVGGERVMALPFSVTYPAALPFNFPPTALKLATFMAGSSAFAATDRDTETALTNQVSNPRLGAMGFCRTGGKSDYLYFPRDLTGDHGKNDVKRALFWLDDQQSYRDLLLGRLGHVAGLQMGDFTFKHRMSGGAADLLGHFTDSVSFKRVGDTTHIIFRSAIVSRTGSGVGSGDLKVIAFSPTVHHFAIRNPDQREQYIDTRSETLIVELDVAYRLQSEDVWRIGENGVGDPEVTVRIGFEDNVNAKLGKIGLGGGKSPATTNVEELVTDAIRGMRLARLDLQHIDAPQPQSTLAEIEVTGAGVRFALTGQVDARFASGGSGAIDWGGRPEGDAWSGARFRLSVWPSGRYIGSAPDPTEVENPLRAKLTFYSLAYASSHRTFNALLNHDEAAPTGGRGTFAQFRLSRPPTAAPAQKFKARLGGIEFTTLDGGCLWRDEPNADDYSYWRFAQRPALSDGADANRFYRTAGIDLRLRLEVSSVAPIGVDVPKGDRTGRPRPLLVRSGAPSGDGLFVLDLRETISADADRHLTAALIDRAGDTASFGMANDYVVLGEEPFSIVRFRSVALGNRGSQDNAQVASYDSDTRSWQLKLTQQNYHYEFPPQVAGESMDKPRRLEIHDPEPTKTGLQTPIVHGVPLGARVVEFRLAPSTEIWVQPSDVTRGYFLPEWASFEIFRQSGAFGLGAALTALRGEFLYGLSVGVDVSRETGPARGARVAEIEALTGRPPGEPRASNPDRSVARRWDGISRAIARRPERLEIWNRDLKSGAAFAPARFEAGVTFALRGTAVHRPPVPQAKITDAKDFNRGTPRSRPHGLSGGALWPVESANLFRRLLERPESDGGTLERVALSPHGGDADQTAKFLGQQVAVISETRSGFVQRHKVEVIGRIGVFWHRAKHVVVYERTVNPTAQFTPEGGIGTRTRRPVLRKVSEYVELLQPQRRYPDFDAAKPASAGFLDCVRFNSTIINVDSAWSEDIEDYGWKIPLWNRDSARLRPQVYPRPDIAFVTRAEGEGERPLAAQECLDPDNLYFFADFETGGDDTDIWQPRVGVDLSALPAPAHWWQAPLDTDAAVDGERRLPGALRIPRGHRRYTWRLGPASKKTALNAGRSDEPLFAGLESITFMRSTTNAPAGDALKNAVRAAAKLVPLANRLPSWARADNPPAPFADLGGALKNYLAAAAANDEPATVAAANVLKAELAKTGDELKKGAAGTLGSYLEHATDSGAILGELKSLIGDPPARCDKLADDFLGSLQRKQLLILENISAWENDAYSIVRQFTDPTKLEELKARLIEEAVDAIRPVFAGLSADRLELGRSIEAARGIVRDFEIDVLSIETAFDKKLAEMRRTYDDGKPWSDNRIRSLLAKLDAERLGVIGSVASAISDAQSRLSTELDDLSRRVGAVAAEALSLIGEQAGGLKAEFDRREAAIAELLDKAVKRIDGLLAVDGSGQNAFDRIDTQLAKVEGQVPAPLRARINQFRTTISNIKPALDALRSKLIAIQAQVDPGIEVLARIVMQAAAAASGAVKQFVAATDEALAILDVLNANVAAEIVEEFETVTGEINDAIGSVLNRFASEGAVIDQAIAQTETFVRDTLDTHVFPRIRDATQVATEASDALLQKAAAFADVLTADRIVSDFIHPFIDRVVNRLFAGFTTTPSQERLDTIVSLFAETARDEFHLLGSAGAIETVKKKLIDACNALGGGLAGAIDQLEKLGENLKNEIDAQISKLNRLIGNPSELVKAAKQFDRDIRLVGNQLGATYSAATCYAEKVFDTAGNIGSGGLSSLPNNVLKLYAAAATAPDLPNLDFARERLGYYYEKLNDVIDTTPVEAWFGRLGDELKALGLSLPFDKLGDRLLPSDLSSFDISRIFRNFGGLKLDKLFRGYKLPKGASDAIKVTHSFDKKLFRAWVQVDVDLSIPERRTLFNIGPFALDFVGSRLAAQVRLESSKDTDKVDQTGRAVLSTDIEAVVSGQTMVSLRKVAARYERSSGLKIDFDPKNIKLNPTFQFIQDTLGSLFPDDFGALKLIKQNGIPIGVEHEFSIPPIDLMYGTSGVTNIQISNRFALVAYPDFVISDRFSLSKPELPFIFSIFIIGGTGYITVDTEYRPFDNRLMVIVEAAAGGSAALGFAFGPISGSVMITLSVALAYRKLIGSSGGGLTVSMVLLIAGNVNVAGIVTVYIGLLLRMAYRDNGQIDATGTLTVTIRISRFFKISVRANVQYKMRGGRSETTTSLSSETEITDPKLAAAKDKADKLLKARG